MQKTACLPVIIVHGDAVVQAGAPAVVLRAPDTARRRGYPLNVGLEYCLAQADLKYAFILDDDDIVYPFFTYMMGRAFAQTDADVVYSPSNRRAPGQAASVGFPVKPFPHLLTENFIASNSFAMRLEKLRETGVRVDETLEYLEDWHFLLRMLKAGCRFHALPLTLSEFVPHERVDPEWETHASRIRQFIETAQFSIPGPELAKLANANANAGRHDDAHVAKLRARIAELENSLSWRGTKPVRDLIGALRRKG